MHLKSARSLQVLLLGLSLALFTPSPSFAQDICPNDSPRSMAAGDFNGDGKLDIALVQQGSGNVFIYTGNGSGGLADPTTTSSGLSRPTSVVAGNFVSSGGLDLAVAGFTASGFIPPAGLRILAGDGTGGFTVSQTIPLGSSTTLFGAAPAVTTGDFDGDGLQDLAVVNANTQVFIFRQQTSGGFVLSGQSSVLTGPNDVATGSFNTSADQHLDLAVANRFQSLGQVSVRLGNGAGGIASGSNIQTGGEGPQAIVTGKFNNDNHLDLAVLHFGSTNVSILLGDGAGGFLPAEGSPISLPVRDANGASLVAHDFNGDGNLDLAASVYSSISGENNIFVLLGNGQGGFPTILDLQAQEGFPPFPPSSIVAADFNEDTVPDLAASFFCSGQVAILINPNPPPGQGMVYVTNREDDTVSVIDPLINQVIDTVAVGHKPHGITLTPDGKEAYVANRNDDNVSVIKTGTTAGSNMEILTIPVGNKPEGVGAANVPDRGAKVFVANRNDDTISVIDAVPSSSTFHDVISTVHLPMPKNQKPVAVAFSPDGACAYVAAEESNRLFVIDAKKAIDDPANAIVGFVAVGRHPKAVDVSNDGKIYVANRGNSTVSKLTPGTPCAQSLPQVTATIQVARHPEGVSLLPDGSKAYVTNRETNKVMVIDTNTDTVTTTIAVGKHPLGIDTITLPTGVFAYAAEEGDNSVAAINTSTNSVVATIPVGKHPRGVAAGKVPVTQP